MQFIATLVTMTGAGIFLLSINLELGLATLVPAVFIFLFTKFASPWIKKEMPAVCAYRCAQCRDPGEPAQTKVIIAFNRRDYFPQPLPMKPTPATMPAPSPPALPITSLSRCMASLQAPRNLSYQPWHLPDFHRSFSIGLLVSYLAYATNFL